MTSIFTDQTSILETAQYWSLDDNNNIIATADEHAQIVSVEHLEALHPYLPVALRAMIVRHNKIHDFLEPLANYLVVDTLDLLQHGGASVPDSDGNFAMFTYIDTIEIPLERDGTIVLGGVRIETAQISYGDNMVPYIIDSQYYCIETNRARLVSAHPYWEEKYNVIQDLGLDNSDLLREVFIKTTEPAVVTEITSITFD